MVEFNITDIVKQISISSPEMAVTGFRKKSSGHIKPGPAQPNKNQVICEWWDEKTSAFTNRVFEAGMLILVRKVA